MNRPSILFVAALAVASAACASSSGGDPAGDAPAPSGAATPSKPPEPPAASAGSAADASAALFTEEQAGRGRTVFRGTCADCHYSSEFRDAQFKFKWGKRTVADLYRNIVENMPEDAPGSLPAQQYLDVVTYILQLNGFGPGAIELTADEAIMQAHVLEAPTGQSGPPARHP